MNLRKEIKEVKEKTPYKKREFTLVGKNVAITGKHSRYKRLELLNIISRAGGEVNENVTTLTDCLLVGNRPGKTKLNRARRYGIKELDLNEIIQGD